MIIENSTNDGELNQDAQLSEDDAAQAFMNQWSDGESPSEEGTHDKPEVKDSKDDEDESEDEDAEESDEAEDEDTDAEDSDEADDEDQESETEDDSNEEPTEDTKDDLLDKEVEFKVGDEVKKTKVKDLIRLAGQEAANTQKSQAIAAQRKSVEAHATKQAMILDKIYAEAQKRFEPFKDVDMLAAANQLPQEEFTKLRQAAQEAHEHLQFVTQEAEAFQAQQEAWLQEQINEQAKEAVKVLSDPEKGIKGWSVETYDKIKSYAVSQGLPEEAVNKIVNPESIKLINKARLYDAMVAAKGKTKVVNKTVSTKVVKPSKSSPQELKTDVQAKTMKKLQSTGSTEDAANAFLARWTQE